MKVLPCRPQAPQNGCADGLAKCGALLYYAASWPGQPGQPLTYQCSGCRRLTTITAMEFNALPEAQLDQATREHLAKDAPP